MTPLNCFTCAWLSALLLLNSAQLPAAPLNQINQLMAEREKLNSETQAIQEQTVVDQARIEQLKRRIELLHAQNKILDQRILKEIELYENKTHIISNDENKLKTDP